MPMVLLAPGVRKGSRVKHPVGQVDVLRTVAGALGVDHGQWGGTDLRVAQPDTVLSWASGRVVVRDAEVRVRLEREVATGVDRFYPLDGEQDRTIEVDAAVAQRLSAAADRVGTHAASADAIDMSEDALEQLRALGYVE